MGSVAWLGATIRRPILMSYTKECLQRASTAVSIALFIDATTILLFVRSSKQAGWPHNRSQQQQPKSHVATTSQRQCHAFPTDTLLHLLMLLSPSLFVRVLDKDNTKKSVSKIGRERRELGPKARLGRSEGMLAPWERSVSDAWCAVLIDCRPNNAHSFLLTCNRMKQHCFVRSLVRLTNTRHGIVRN